MVSDPEFRRRSSSLAFTSTKALLMTTKLTGQARCAGMRIDALVTHWGCVGVNGLWFVRGQRIGNLELT